MSQHTVRKHRMPARLAVLSSLLGAAFAVAGSAAQAQPIETITVTAPRIVQQTITTGRTYTGTPVETTTISRNVNFGDLNLTKHADVEKLKMRVKDTAKDLCKELDKLYPLQPKDETCVRKSEDRAMVQVNNAIKEAAGK